MEGRRKRVRESSPPRRSSRKTVKQIRLLLDKNPDDLTLDETRKLHSSPEIVAKARASARRIEMANRRKSENQPDCEDDLKDKLDQLVQLIRESEVCVAYTGAGVSTSADIPDFRSASGGAWRNPIEVMESLEKCERSPFVHMKPTFAHRALAQLVKQGHVQYILSQNCDGLHLRSGVHPSSLSEVHGNMFMEVCTNCSPERLLYRTFDVTEDTRYHRHHTSRICPECGHSLLDTIVHLGERNRSVAPMNWLAAEKAAQEADLIICMGTSLKVLKSYHCLWNSRKTTKAKLVIVNLENTDKDHFAHLKLRASCDRVMEGVTDRLDIKVDRYSPENDLLISLSTALSEDEKESHTTPDLLQPDQAAPGYVPGWLRVGIRSFSKRKQKKI